MSKHLKSTYVVLQSTGYAIILPSSPEKGYLCEHNIHNIYISLYESDRQTGS